jgi:hypothetical protein
VSRHRNKGFLNANARGCSEKVRLPDERTGTFMVFKTFDRMSYGLIMEAKDIIRVAIASRIRKRAAVRNICTLRQAATDDEARA